jgi:CheY-like chemotaxis protein
VREPRRRRRILLVEDNPVNQKLAIRMLEKWGHAVTLAADGQQAAAIFEASGPDGFDLVLMDVQMPVMNGFEATGALRRIERRTGTRVPIVAMTAHAMKGDDDRCLAAGMDGYLSKPIDAAKLFDIIEGVQPSAAPPPPAPPSASSQLWDPDAALDRVGGDDGLLREMAGLLAAELPRLLGDVRAAVVKADGDVLERAAHKLKGAVGVVGAPDVIAAARQLEGLGRTRDLAQAGAVMQALDREVDRLMPALAQFAAGGSAKPR